MDLLYLIQITTSLIFFLNILELNYITAFLWSLLLYIVYRIYEYSIRKPLIICVEGNIGTGKTTFLNILEKFGYFVVREPVDIWKEHGLLGNFYEDMSRWSYTFQNYAFMTRLQVMRNIFKTRKRVVFVERSIYTDRNVFAKNLHNDGKLSDMEWKIYKEWFVWLKKIYNKAGCPVEPDGFVYLKALPTVSHERIKKRARSEEDCIQLEYLTRLHRDHENWLLNESRNKIPILVVRCNEDFENNNTRQKAIFEGIEDFLKSI